MRREFAEQLCRDACPCLCECWNAGNSRQQQGAPAPGERSRETVTSLLRYFATDRSLFISFATSLGSCLHCSLSSITAPETMHEARSQESCSGAFSTQHCKARSSLSPAALSCRSASLEIRHAFVLVSCLCSAFSGCLASWMTRVSARAAPFGKFFQHSCCPAV